MNYAGFLLRKERLGRNWSQEGLCRGICTVSYLSKIEQGKAVPADDTLRLLLERLDLKWYDGDAEISGFIEQAYEVLFGYDRSFAEIILSADRQKLMYSPYGLDFLLLEQFAMEKPEPLDEALEVCFDLRQLALQRLLQDRFDEAISLCPRAFFHCIAGQRYYQQGEIARALEALQGAYQLAAQEGHPRIMLHCKLLMGNCYSNQQNMDAMKGHYAVAKRLAHALGEDSALEEINYNIAATQIECGEYEKALTYFETIESPSRMEFHKLAICYEKMKQPEKAMAALSQAEQAEESPWMPEGLEELMLKVVQFRLSHEAYLECAEYGRMLLECFNQCCSLLPSGYGVFHLPWVLEWYEANRQFKKALAVLKSFPGINQEMRFKA